MKKESGLKEFIRLTYKTGSPIPYIISAQIFFFVAIHLCDLLVEIGATKFPLYDWLISNLGLPNNVMGFLYKPWTLITYPFLYTGLFNIVFDCMMLYWLGSAFLNLLNKRQFLTLFFGSILISGLIYPALGEIAVLNKGPQQYLFSTSMGLAALVASLITLMPRMEIHLFLFGRVKFYIIALIYFGLELFFYAFASPAAAVTFVISIGFGVLYLKQLQKGKDLSKLFELRPSKKLQVVYKEEKKVSYKSYKADLPNQEMIDEILDKISQSGYESLSSREKEILFKVSREEQK